MANQQVKINLLFDANTSAAQSNIQQLATLLQTISTKTIVGVDSGSLQQAVGAAQQLQVALQNAVNVDTGKIDLMKLQADLKQSGTSLQTLTSQLRAVGPTGEQAFLKVANAVAQAEVPMIKANGLVKNFMTTLANTAKWQIASSAIHAIIGAFQSATAHAKNLNKALTDIQIVTHASTAEMAAFAEKATQAASALNTTSTEYAKAALIFYQQGLSGDAVTERADTVIKLAQVTGQSAQIVSDQMTSIWNNFDDGSKSLEYYADVLTKLGATTAASTDEIAQGLQKFSAIAGTVGMEYETAAAAIATVVAETRQSADVVGTAFKTIFARIQGLSLGETLEDGVDLNKYSKALSAVGVEVLTADGELRKMDDILADLGEKWQGLGEETQVALAQVVGGTRQYAQMIALMDNWDKVTDNIDDAKDATGELAAQQEIWTHSYEASMTRMTQAKNELYESFINDDFLIGWNDAITVLTKSFTSFIDRIGGLGPFLFSLVGIFSKTLFPLITTGLTKISNMLAIHTGKAAQQVASMQSQMSNSIGAMLDNPQFTEGMKKQLTLTQQLLGEKQKLMLASKTMTEAQKLEAQSRLQVAEAIMNETMQILQQQDALEKQARAAKDSLTSGKQKWDVATTSAENSFRAKSDANAASDETEEQAAARHAADDEIINTAKTTGAGTLETQIANARKYQANQQQLDAWAPTVQKTDEQAANGEAWSREDQSIRDQAANKSAEQEKLLATLPEDALSDLDAYIEKLTKAREIQKDIYNIVNDSEGKGVAGASVGSAEVKHDASFGEGEEVGKVEANQLQNIADSSEGAISFNQETGALGMEASLANYEKLYQVLGEHKVLQSELAAATQEVGAAQEAAKGKTAEYEAATEELATAEKELAALEKKMSKSGKTLTNARKAELKQISKGSKEYKKLSKEEKDYVKIQEKVKKATENQTKAQKKAITQFTAQKKSYEDLATKAGATGDQMKKLTSAFDALESGSGDVDDQFKIISSVFKELGISSDGVSGDIVELGNKMQTMLSTAGYSDDQIDILTQAFQELANTAPQAANGIKGTEGALGGLNSKAPTLASSFGSMAQNAMTLAGNMMSLKSGIEGITTAFTEGGSAAEIMQGVLTGIMGIMPTVIAITNAAKAAQDRRNKSTLEGVGADVAKTASEGVKTGVTWANTIANIANLLSNPWTMALAAVAIVAIGVVCASMESKTEATEANTQANLENAESTNELSSAWADATTAMDTAIAKFNELTAAGKDTKQSIQDIIDAIPDLVQSYRDAAASMAGLTDEERTQISETADYIEQQKELLKVAKDPETQQEIINNINEAQAKNDNVISENAAEEAQKGADAAMAQTAKAIVDVGDAEWEDGKVKRHVGGSGTQKRKDYGVKNSKGETVTLNEEEASVDILMQAFGQGRNVDRKNGFDISLDTGSSEDFLADYEKLMEAATQMENQLGDQLDNSDTYREVKDMLNGSKEQYEKLKEMQAEADKYGVFDAKSNLEAQTFEGSGEKMAVENISSMEEYKKYKDALLSDENVQDPAAQEIAKQWLESNAALEKYVAAEKRIEGIRDNAGDAVAEDLYKMVDQLDDEQTALFLEVDVNKYQTEAAIMSEIERLQGVADQEEIQLKIEAINNAQSALKESGMTQEDWTTIKDSGIDWGNEEAGIMEFTDFLKMSYSEQQAYLQQMETAQNEALIESAQATKASLEENLANLDKNSATYAQDKQLIEEQIEAEESRLAILEKTAKAQMWEDQGLNAGEVEEYASALEELPLVETREEAEAIAAANMRMNKGIDALAEGWEEWGAALKSGNKSSQQYAAALKGVKTAVADVLDTDTDQFTDDFLTSAETLGLLEKVAQGDMEALAELQQQAALNVTGQIKIDTNQTELQSQLDSINSWITDFPDLEIGASLDSTGMTAAFQALLDSGAMTVDQMNAILNNIGFEPEITYKEMTVAEAKAAKQTAYLKTDTGEYTQVTDEVKLQDDAKVWVPVINGKNTSYQGPPKTSLNQKKDGGGGGGDKKKADKAKKSDTVERYKEVTDALDDNADAMDKASRAADRLYGKDRLSKMREVNKLLQKEIDLTKQKKKEAENYLKIDKAELDAMAAEAGVSFTYDSKGNISNYEEEMTKLFNELDSAINKANADGNADENEQKEIDAIQEKIDKVKDAMSTYEDTRELIEDLDTELEEKLHEWQDANFEILNTELELKIEINDMDLQRLEYYLGKMEDDFYQMAEAAALMVMNANGDGFGGQLTSYMDQLQHQEDYLEKLRKQYEAGEISQANYIEGLKNASSAIYEQLGSLQELDATMMEYYSETLAAAGEEIAKYTELMENATGVLDHYASIAEMLGKSTDYKYMGKILQAQADVASNAYKVSKANYEMLKKQEDERKQAYDDAVARNASESELEMLEKQWWDARAAANEAQDTMLSDVETWAEALRAVLDNSIAGFGQELENTLTAGYGSFDAMTSAFERKNALQEEYLTTTNKIYETNKMMRTAQQEIDKTTNEAAKRRLKQFINETDALQDQSKLSQYELEIQQAKYDLLLAEIALEEAQNAKSTVRLQRDNEGNMSYVYTADQNKIADAQQKVEDAQNALYNKGLEGANDYVQKYQETMQEMYDTLTEIQQNYLDGAYESEEEYNNAIEEAKEYYYEKLTQYSNLYQVALTTDTRVAADAWTTEFASMTENTEDWMTAVNGYVGDVQGAFATWKSQMDTIEKETLGNMDETLSNIVSDSEDLAETVTDEVVPALEAEMNAVKDVTDKYATFRETLESITKEYEAMAKAAENAVKAANGLEDGTDTGGPGDGSENDQEGDSSEGDNGSGTGGGDTSTTTLTWDRVKAVYNAINGGKWGHGAERKKNGKAAGYTDEEIAKGQELINKVYGGMSLAAAKTALGFASGGYTGDWSGSYGKLAFLHKKELILKQGDTENFLASMEILERILQMIDLQATSAQLGGILTTPKFSHYNDGVLEQNVHIEASFPGVTDHNEVELAMTNLINTASQYANRK